MAREPQRKRSLLRQIEIEIISAQNSIEFWRAQLPLHAEEPLKSAVERSLENALARFEQLETLKAVIRSS